MILTSHETPFASILPHCSSRNGEYMGGGIASVAVAMLNGCTVDTWQILGLRRSQRSVQAECIRQSTLYQAIR